MKVKYTFLLAILLLTSYLSAQTRGVVITEVLYDSPLQEAMYKTDFTLLGVPHHNGEYIELYNFTESPISLSSWRIRTESKQSVYEFPKYAFIYPKSFVIIAYRHKDTPDFELHHVFPEAVPEGNNQIFYQDKIYLRNRESKVVLYDNNGKIVDEVYYNNDGLSENNYWKIKASNSCQPPSGCRSLQRVGADDYNSSKIVTNFTVDLRSPFGFGDLEFDMRRDPKISDEQRGFTTLFDDIQVGSIAGTFNTSSSGGAVYEMQIDIPEGINGVSPQIGLVYNSQSGNGIAGWGFNIKGLSSITRVPKSIYMNGTFQAISNTYSDQYALDGNNLIVVSGTNGKDGAEYRLENDNFSRIYSRGNYQNSACDYFEVKDKEGNIYKYGSSTGKLPFSANAKNTVQCWNLDYFENPDGLTIKYEYENDSKSLSSYIKKITYGSNTIEFTYTSRSDIIPLIFDETTGKIDKLLSRIVVKCNGSIYREYDLKYNIDHFSRLKSVQVSSYEPGTTKKVKLNPTIFEWGKYPLSTVMTVEEMSVYQPAVIKENGAEFNKQFYTSLDINGDGLSDMIGMFPYQVYSGNITEYYTAVQIYIAKKQMLQN